MSKKITTVGHGSEGRSKANTRGSSRGRETSKDRIDKNNVGSRGENSRKESKTVTSTGARPSNRSVPDVDARKMKPERSRETAKPSKTTAGVYGAPKASRTHEKTRSTVGNDGSTKRSSVSGAHEAATRQPHKSSTTRTPAVNTEAVTKRPLIKQDTITLASKEKVIVAAEEEADDYEDDFEDYESDFENSSGDEEKSDDASDREEVAQKPAETVKFSEPASLPTTSPVFLVTGKATSLAYEIVPKRKFVNEPRIIDSEDIQTKNQERVSTANESRTESATSNHAQNQVSHSHIDFSNAKQSQSAKKALGKAKERGQQLLELINLDSVSFTLFSKTPVAYSEFMETFGNMNARQACVQTGEDSVPEESQTDVIEKLDLWTQFPPHTCGAIGGQYISQQKKVADIHGVKDWKRLNKFVKESGKVICAILEEEKTVTDDDAQASKSNDLPKFSERVEVLKLPQFAHDRAVSYVRYNKYQTNLLLAIYRSLTTSEESENALINKGIICVWNIFQPTRPQEVLVCSSQPVCCCFGGNSEFVFAGMVDGSVATWDLRESSCSHRTENVNNSEWVWRSPTYSTAEVMGDGGHHSPVVSILCNQGDSSKFNEKSSKGIIQVATLEEQACIHIWVLTNVTRAGTEAVSNTDLGLRPDGCIKLMKSAIIDLTTIPTLRNYLENNGRVLDFECSSQDQSTFYVTTDTSIIIRCTVNNMKPKVYLETPEADNSVEVASLSFSPFEEFNYFLTGNCEGNVKLFSTAKEKPIMTWTCRSRSPAIRKVLWSSSSPNIFYCLDSGGVIHLWDLYENNYAPVISAAMGTKRIDSFDLSNGSKYKNDSTTKLHPNIAVGYDNGNIEVHFLIEKYSRNTPKDQQMFKEYVNEL